MYVHSRSLFLVTARVAKQAKVMFSQVSVIMSTGGGDMKCIMIPHMVRGGGGQGWGRGCPPPDYLLTTTPS